MLYYIHVYFFSIKNNVFNELVYIDFYNIIIFMF